MHGCQRIPCIAFPDRSAFCPGKAMAGQGGNLLQEAATTHPVNHKKGVMGGWQKCSHHQTPFTRLTKLTSLALNPNHDLRDELPSVAGCPVIRHIAFIGIFAEDIILLPAGPGVNLFVHINKMFMGADMVTAGHEAAAKRRLFFFPTGQNGILQDAHGLTLSGQPIGTG